MAKTCWFNVYQSLRDGRKIIGKPQPSKANAEAAQYITERSANQLVLYRIKVTMKEAA